MGQTRRRMGADGRPRYTAYYVDATRKRRSAGTFTRRRDAEIAWQTAEIAMASARPTDPRRGQVTFARYVDETWFPNHVIEASTRQSYRYCLDRHVMPTFGPMRMREILPIHVREWVTTMAAAGVSPATIRSNKIILSAVFTTALNDFVIALHPCRGVKTPTVAVKEYRILTPEEFDRLHAVLPTAQAQLLVETAVESGLRWGELTELRRRDLHVPSGILTVSRSVTAVQPQYSPDGSRFVVKPYPKGRRSRRFRLNPALVAAIAELCEHEPIETDGLLFTLDRLLTPPRVRNLVSVDALGWTAPTDSGRSYRHGTLSAYTAGSCRCAHCREVFAAYRARRRLHGLDASLGVRSRDTDGHIPNDWFRSRIWQPACLAAGIDPPVRLHDLRHSHASWLLAGGADLQVVKERLGHRSIATTEKYLHTLPDADNTALAALDRIRHRDAWPTDVGLRSGG